MLQNSKNLETKNIMIENKLLFISRIKTGKCLSRFFSFLLFYIYYDCYVLFFSFLKICEQKSFSSLSLVYFSPYLPHSLRVIICQLSIISILHEKRGHILYMEKILDWNLGSIISILTIKKSRLII